MLPSIQEHIHKGVVHLARSPQHPRVVTFRPDAPAPDEVPVDGPCEPDPEPLHAAVKRARAVGLDEKMHMIRLDGEMGDAE
jgi:hypothetical protein